MGKVIQLEVGATNVGSIQQTFSAGTIDKGQEKGYFAFGGSAIATVFEPGSIRLAEDLTEHSSECREVYAHVGDVMGYRK